MRKNRFLTLCLAVILLFGMIPVTALASAAAPQFKVSLTLSDSIAINFKMESEAFAAESFEKIEFYNGDTLLETVTQLPSIDNEGMYVFSYKDIEPDMMDYTVTAKLYAGGLCLVKETSVAAFCHSILLGADIYGKELSVLAMEILDYGAAAQQYIAAKQGTTVADTELVNYGVAQAYPKVAALCDNSELTYGSVLSIANKVENAQADWVYAGLYLQDKIVLRYGFEAASTDGLTMQVVSGENVWSVSEFKAAGDHCWDAYFDGLNPARMRDSVTVTMYKDGRPVSSAMTYSVESYIARMTRKSDDETLGTMLLEMLRYGDAAAKWEEVRTDADPVLEWETLAVVDLETGTLEDNLISKFNDTSNKFSLAENIGHNSSRSLQIDNGGRAKYYRANQTLKAGWYRISGYVKLNGADPKTVSITSWRMEEGASRVATAYSFNNAIIGQADANGWSYFEIYTRQMADMPTFQITLNNNGGSGKTIYFDDIVYEKHLETASAEPEVTEPIETEPVVTEPVVTEPVVTEPEVTEPEETETVWEDLIEVLDFEQGVLEPMKAHTGAPFVQAQSSSYAEGHSLRLEKSEQAMYSQKETLVTGWYRLRGYMLMEEGADPSKIGITVWAYTGTSQNNAKVVSLSECMTGQTDANGWNYFEIDFEHKAKYSLIQFVVKNNGTNTVYFDDLEYAQYGETGQPAATTGENWNVLASLDFEETDFPMSAYSSNPVGDFGDIGRVADYVLCLNTGDRASYSQQKVSQPATSSYKIAGWFKKENPKTAVSISYWYRQDSSANAAKSVTITEDHILSSTENGWYYFEIPVTHNADTDFIQFIVNNNISTGANGGYVYFNDLRYMRAYDDIDYLVAQWDEQLAQEQQDSMMEPSVLDDPYQEVEPIGKNLIVNGSFSAQTDLVLMDREVQANTTGWTTVDVNTYDTYSKITPEGTFYGAAPVGYNDPAIYERPVPQLSQKLNNLIPGATYQVKFRYKIEASNKTNHTWYGPYVLLNSSSDKVTLAVDKSTEGLNTSGQWQWFTQTVTMFDQVDYVQFNLCIWLYEGDWCEIDDVEFCLVDYGKQIDLDVQTKFFYTDMITTVFRADLKESANSDIAGDADATVKFEVFDGKSLVWNSQNMKLSGEGYTTQVTFDLTKLTKLGAPYVLKATLYNGSGEEVYATSEQIFIYERPTSLDANGNYVKQTPNGEKLDFNIAYAITKDDYEKTKEIGSNVMSLSNAKNAEQVLSLLDYCYEHGFMGMLNMNWGLYNDADIDQKRWVLIDVASDERIRNHPSMLGYCLTDEPWSWGSEQNVAENLEEGYRLIREYDKENIIFSVNNMAEYHTENAKYSDVMLVDHYEAPTNGTVYNKVHTAVEAAAGRMPVWAVLGAYKQKTYYPTGMQVRNEMWQAFLAGAKGIGYYAVSYSDYDAEGQPVSIWDVTDANGNPIGQETWDAMASFKEKEWDIAYDRFADGKGKLFNEKLDTGNGYLYSTWVAENGEVYMVVLNISSETKFIPVSLKSSNGKVSLGEITDTVINGGTPTGYTIGQNFYVSLEANQVVLYKLTPTNNVDFSLLD